MSMAHGCEAELTATAGKSSAPMLLHVTLALASAGKGLWIPRYLLALSSLIIALVLQAPIFAETSVVIYASQQAERPRTRDERRNAASLSGLLQAESGRIQEAFWHWCVGIPSEVT